jgi:hypothetical protein
MTLWIQYSHLHCSFSRHQVSLLNVKILQTFFNLAKKVANVMATREMILDSISHFDNGLAALDKSKSLYVERVAVQTIYCPILPLQNRE